MNLLMPVVCQPYTILEYGQYYDVVLTLNIRFFRNLNNLITIHLINSYGKTIADNKKQTKTKNLSVYL